MFYDGENQFLRKNKVSCFRTPGSNQVHEESQGLWGSLPDILVLLKVLLWFFNEQTL